MPTKDHSTTPEKQEEHTKRDISEEKDWETEDLPYTEQTSTGLSFRQKIQIGGVAMISFLLFAILLFPYQKIIQNYLFGLSERTPLSFNGITIRLFGTSNLQGIHFQLSPKTSMQVGNVEARMSLLGLLRGNAHGKLNLKDFQFDTYLASLSISDALLKIKLNQFKSPPNKWEGQTKLVIRGLKLVELNLSQLAGIGLNIEDIRFQQASCTLLFRNGNVQLSSCKIPSNYFTLNLKGNSRLPSQTTANTLNVEFCIKPSPDLEEKNSELMGFYLLAGGTSGGELCKKVQGSFLHPKISAKENKFTREQKPF